MKILQQYDLKKRVMSKIYFYEGDIVKIKQDIPNSPDMVIESLDKIAINPGDKKTMNGIRCFWFCKNGTIQKNRFDFKDLVIVKRATSYDK